MVHKKRERVNIAKDGLVQGLKHAARQFILHCPLSGLIPAEERGSRQWRRIFYLKFCCHSFEDSKTFVIPALKFRTYVSRDRY